ncbi:baseplate J protein [Paenibacillus sp. LMG 31457]|uniref:Baseplate J protein n=2 Tax=Paenibacillus planticolens TaxID=2654976 RepID=A0ABX1ZI40_9BACL|nr:baseplate J protein [Paenibacillus planticolens]
MLDATASDIDKRQGSVTYDMLSPAAIELALAYAELDNVLKFGFADTTYGNYLDMRCGELGVYRKQAVKATGSLTFTGPNATVIPLGTRVSTGGNSPVYFVTTAAGTIASGMVTVTAEASSGGASGNVALNTVTLVLGNLAGVVTVINAASFSGGSDVESDADLLARYTERVRKPATSGNANQYLAWAKEVAGVGDAKVYPIWNGAGTVKVVLLNTEKTAPSASVVTAATDYITLVKPVGATATVAGATEVAINVSGNYTLKSGATLTQARAQILAGLTAYLKTVAFVDPIVRYSQIANVVLTADAVTDYDPATLTVNGAKTNVTIADGSVAVAGTVT